MNVADLIATVFFVGAAGLRGREAGGAWREPGRWRPGPASMWRPLVGKQVARGLQRALLAQVIVLGSVAVMMASLTVATVLPAGAASSVRHVFGTFAVIGVLVGLVVAVLIVVANRPTFLVPPPCRGEDGILVKQKKR